MPSDLMREVVRLDNRRIDGERIAIEAKHLRIYACEFRDCDFSKSKVKESFVPGHSTMRSYFTECNFEGARLALGPAGAARFERCSFRGARLRQWFWDEVDLVNCDFAGAKIDGNIRGSALPTRGQRRRVNEIVGNDFSTADVTDVGFNGGVDLSLQILPTAPGYVFVADASATLASVRAEVIRWDDLNLRRSIFKFVEQYQFYLDDGQEQILFHPAAFRKQDHEQAQAFAALLRAHGGRALAAE